MCSSFLTETGQARREDGGLSRIHRSAGKILIDEIHGAPVGSFVPRLAAAMGGMKSEKDMALFWSAVVKEVLSLSLSPSHSLSLFLYFSLPPSLSLPLHTHPSLCGLNPDCMVWYPFLVPVSHSVEGGCPRALPPHRLPPQPPHLPPQPAPPAAQLLHGSQKTAPAGSQEQGGGGWGGEGGGGGQAGGAWTCGSSQAAGVRGDAMRTHQPGGMLTTPLY